MTDEEIKAIFEECVENHDSSPVWFARSIISKLTDQIRLAMEVGAWEGALQLSDALANIDDAAKP